MIEKAKTLRAVMSSAVAMICTASGSAVVAAEPAMEQCAGVIRAGRNDCATSTNACHSHVTTDSNPEAWIYVPAGTCAKISGARVVKVKDPTPVKK